MRTSLLILVAVIAASQGAEAQTLFQSGDGKASFLVREGGLFTVNLADKSMEIGYTYGKTNVPLVAGVRAKAKATDGFAALFEAGEGVRVPEVDVAAYAGVRLWPALPFMTDLFLGAELEYGHGSFRLADVGADGDPFSRDTSFNRVLVRGRINSLAGELGPLDIGWGVSVGYGGKSNYASIEKLELCTEFASTPEAATTRRLVSCKEARRASKYRADELWEGTFDLVLWQPWFREAVHGLIDVGAGVDAFARYDEARADDKWAFGLYLFFTKGGSPRVPLGGLTLQWRGGDFQAGLQTSIPFGGA